MKLADIAARIGGRIEGDGCIDIDGMAGLAEAKAGDISFLANPKYSRLLGSTRASAVVVKDDCQVSATGCALVRVKDPDGAFALIAEILGPEPAGFPEGINPLAFVHADAEVGQGASIGPFCVVESGARIGKGTVLVAGCYVGRGSVIGCNCLLYAHVSVRERVTIGDRAIIHNGAVIGSDGFGYARDASGWRKIRQIGTVEIGDDVEVGANSTIDRARFGKTVIGNGVKIDNLVQVAHNVTIGENSAVAAHVGIAGSVTIGKGVMFGGQAGVAGHITIGDNVIVGGQAGVTKDVPGGTFVSGFPAIDHRKDAKAHANIMRLPELKERVRVLEQKIGKLGMED